MQEEVVPGNHSTGYTNLKTSCSVLSRSFSNYSCGDRCRVCCKTCTQNSCQGLQQPAGQLSDFVLDLACTGDVKAVLIQGFRCLVSLPMSLWHRSCCSHASLGTYLCVRRMAALRHCLVSVCMGCCSLGAESACLLSCKLSTILTIPITLSW
ncbi:hypothetical protein XENORESO_010527 [Xenotaenia resolanae]|uniref:Uncharacterized protein n=1 Tax=Xenotaenia resolanae TaxID=208358 RepID=A0ABV0WEF7_9TELE